MNRISPPPERSTTTNNKPKDNRQVRETNTMTQLGIWRLMTRHQPHEHTLRRPQQLSSGKPTSACDEAEFTKPRPKYERPKEDQKESHPASSEEFTVLEEVGAAASLKRATQKHVSFDTVEVRNYEVILGDNPDCSFPLSLGWRYTTSPVQDVDTYESQQLPQRKKSKEEIEAHLHIGQLLGLNGPTHLSDPMVGATTRPLTMHERRMLLRAQGHSEQALRQAERKRRVELSLQWASGHYPKETAFPYSQRFFLNYVL